MRLRQKIKTLKAYGVDGVLCLRFTQSLSLLTPEAFVQKVLVEHLKISALLIGDDFHFGAQRQGGFALLKDMGTALGFEVERLVTLSRGNQRVSSTAIRTLLSARELRTSRSVVRTSFYDNRSCATRG